MWVIESSEEGGKANKEFVTAIKSLFEGGKPVVNTISYELAQKNPELSAMESIQAGANGYLSKMLPAIELVNALKTFASDGIIIPQQLMGKLIQGLRQGMPSSPSGQSPATLTKTEVRVMDLLGRGKSNKEIATELGCSVKTIKNHLNSIFQKLGVANRTEAVVKAIDKGIISAEDTNI